MINLSEFAFGDKCVPTVFFNGECWLFIEDVAKKLGYLDSEIDRMLLLVDKEHLHVIENKAIINEPGLYNLIFSSTTNEATEAQQRLIKALVSGTFIF